jgi:hypothetical protein
MNMKKNNKVKKVKYDKPYNVELEQLKERGKMLLEESRKIDNEIKLLTIKKRYYDWILSILYALAMWITSGILLIALLRRGI